MSRYIDAEELKSAIRKAFPNLMMRININSIVNKQPTADVVKVVRCKDCKWFDDNECINELGMIYALENNYCSLGERRQNGN